MNAEIVAVGTELLLGQVIDTNSAWIAEQLATAGIDCHYQTRVGDNIERTAAVLAHALAPADAVIVCGGLGPTQDDITREAIAQVFGVELVLDAEAERLLRAVFSEKKREMSPTNLRQAQIPRGAQLISQKLGSAPGLIVAAGRGILYALPGVPHEMKEMMVRSVLPDLRTRAGFSWTIQSRTLRTFGLAESVLAEVVSPRVVALDEEGAGAPTIAFLASGIEGVKIRITVKSPDAETARARLEVEEQEIRAILGDFVFGRDEQTMESSLGQLLVSRGLSLGLAESFTGGLMSSRVVDVAGASKWFTGGIIAYDSQVKFDVLGLSFGDVVSAAAAEAMARGLLDVLHVDVGIATTGVAGPEGQEGEPPGSCYVGLLLPDGGTESFHLQLEGDRRRVRELSTIAAFGALRRRILSY